MDLEPLQPRDNVEEPVSYVNDLPPPYAVVNHELQPQEPRNQPAPPAYSEISPQPSAVSENPLSRDAIQQRPDQAFLNVLIVRSQTILVQPRSPVDPSPYGCHIAWAAIVFLMCNPLFGLIAFILAYQANELARSSPAGSAQAQRLGRASCGVSWTGILVAFFVVAAVVGMNTGVNQKTMTTTLPCDFIVGDDCYEIHYNNKPSTRVYAKRETTWPTPSPSVSADPCRYQLGEYCFSGRSPAAKNGQCPMTALYYIYYDNGYCYYGASVAQSFYDKRV